MTWFAKLRPSQRDGRRDLSHSSSSLNASAVAPRVDAQKRMNDLVGACLLYFGIGSPVLDGQDRASLSRRLIRRYGRYHRLIVSSLWIWSDHIFARHL